MTKILLTGMSAPQCSAAANARTRSYAGVLYSALTDLLGYEVDWIDPNINWTRKQLNAYDAVLVGVSPLTSLSANRAYGGLHVIDTMATSRKLTLFIDAPTPGQITSSLRAISATPSNLTKPFFSYRKFYAEACEPETAARLLNRVELLLSGKWPTTIYPSLPWKGATFTSQMPVGLQKQLVGLNLDALEIKALRRPPLPHRADIWAIDSFKSPWSRATVPGLAKPVSPMTWNKVWTDAQVEEQLWESLGALISSTKLDGTWWTYRYIQSMSTGTPIATEWRETIALGRPWSTLPSEIESLPIRKRDKLADAQRDAYLAAVPSPQEALQALKSALHLNTKGS